ncbi:MAG: type II secretion system protein [Gaiellaceae bacterium]
MERLRKRIAQANGEGGFTLIELLVVIIILGILLAVAVPSYIGFKSKAEASAAKANVRAAVPAIEAFYADNGTYIGVNNAANGTPPGRAYYDPGTANKTYIATSPAPSTSSYCLYAFQTGDPANPGPTYFKSGPSGDILEDKTSPYVTCSP